MALEAGDVTEAIVTHIRDRAEVTVTGVTVGGGTAPGTLT